MLITQRHVSVGNDFKQKGSCGNDIRLPPFFKVVVSLRAVLWQLRLRRSVINSLRVCRPANQNSWLAFYKLFCKMSVGETPTLPLSFRFNTHRAQHWKIQMIASNSLCVHGSEHYGEYWFVLLGDMIRLWWDGIIQGHQDYQDVSMISIETSVLTCNPGSVCESAVNTAVMDSLHCEDWILEKFSEFQISCSYQNIPNWKMSIHGRYQWGTDLEVDIYGNLKLLMVDG